MDSVVFRCIFRIGPRRLYSNRDLQISSLPREDFEIMGIYPSSMEPRFCHRFERVHRSSGLFWEVDCVSLASMIRNHPIDIPLIDIDLEDQYPSPDLVALVVASCCKTNSLVIRRCKDIAILGIIATFLNRPGGLKKLSFFPSYECHWTKWELYTIFSSFANCHWE